MQLKAATFGVQQSQREQLDLKGCQVLLTYKVIGGQAPSYMDKLRPPDHCIRPLYSQSAGLLLVPLNVEQVFEAFSYQPIPTAVEASHCLRTGK